MKVVVAHPHQQHSYRLASAIKKAGHELVYVTTVYNKPFSLTKIVESLLSGDDRKKAQSRRCDYLKDSEVKQFCELGGLIVLLLFRLDRKKRLYNFVYSFVRKKFGIKAARFAHKINADVFIGYDICSLESFEWLSVHDESISRVVDYSAVPLPCQARYAFADLSLEGNAATRQCEDALDPILQNYAYGVKELLLLDYALAASDFTKEALCSCGVRKERVFRASYGFPQLEKTERRKSSERGEPVVFAYCGRLTHAKGVHRLLNAFKLMERGSCRLILVGDYDNSDGRFDDYLDSCTFTGPLIRSEALRQVAQADVFVFPSLTDGMSLSCMEAMALGLPIIVTRSTGASQFVVEGVNGFTVDAGDEGEMARLMTFFVKNPDLIDEMGKASLEIAQSVSWSDYDSSIAAFASLVESDRAKLGNDNER
ncbi:glycosyltransferase family 4 protein [Rubneribacter badeniensis]|nr:hypothetical protein B5F41_11560 [Gordonibacter sp. An232A]